MSVSVARVIEGGDGRLAVEGELTFGTVPDVLKQSASWFERSGGSLRIDLKNVSRADSAGLALLVEWLQFVRLNGRTLAFVNIPEQVHSLIRVNGLGEALGIENRA